MVDLLIKKLEAEAEKIGKPLDCLAGLIEEALTEAFNAGYEMGWSAGYDHGSASTESWMRDQQNGCT